MKVALTQTRLQEVLRYDPETGVFTWLVKRGGGPGVGTVAGAADKDGRRSIRVDGVMHWAHRLAWLWMTGSWPTAEVDHRDTDPANNRWSNLRELSRAGNCQNHREPFKNNTTGFLGVSAKGPSFVAGIKVDGKRRHLGTYPTAAAAHEAYVAAKRQLHEGCTL